MTLLEEAKAAAEKELYDEEFKKKVALYKFYLSKRKGWRRFFPWRFYRIDRPHLHGDELEEWKHQHFSKWYMEGIEQGKRITSGETRALPSTPSDGAYTCWEFSNSWEDKQGCWWESYKRRKL